METQKLVRSFFVLYFMIATIVYATKTFILFDAHIRKGINSFVVDMDFNFLTGCPVHLLSGDIRNDTHTHLIQTLKTYD
jgi:hypothetical protein